MDIQISYLLLKKLINLQLYNKIYSLTIKITSGEKYIFIDRDGVLNEKQERGTYVTNTSLFKWKKGALDWE